MWLPCLSTLKVSLSCLSLIPSQHGDSPFLRGLEPARSSVEVREFNLLIASYSVYVMFSSVVGLSFNFHLLPLSS